MNLKVTLTSGGRKGNKDLSHSTTYKDVMALENVIPHILEDFKTFFADQQKLSVTYEVVREQKHK